MMGSGSSEYRKYGSHARVRRRKQRYVTASRQLSDGRTEGDPCDADERQPFAHVRRRLSRFRAKWIPVRVKKTRQNNNLELRF
jgi:hypothetical protein